MKLVKCIIRAEKLQVVVDALQQFISGLTCMEVTGYGRQRGQKLSYRGLEYQADLLPKAMIEIVIEDNWVDDVIKLVTDTARTGEIGDGRIFVMPVEGSYHIRTGFMDR